MIADRKDISLSDCKRNVQRSMQLFEAIACVAEVRQQTPSRNNAETDEDGSMSSFTLIVTTDRCERLKERISQVKGSA
jgi:hypothetical protein